MIQQLYFQQTVKQTSMNYKNESVLISWKYTKGVAFTVLEANTLVRPKSIKETDGQPSPSADKPNRFLSPLEAVFAFLPQRTFFKAVIQIFLK